MTNRFHSRSRRTDHLQGKLLIASPYVQRNSHDVFLVLQVDEHHVFGVNMGKPAGEELAATFEETTGIKLQRDALLLGGPLSGPVFAIHTQHQHADEAISEQLFLTMQTDSIDQITRAESEPVRIVFGVNSWHRAEMEREIADGRWCIVDATTADLWEQPDGMWFHSLRKYGLQTLADTVGIREFPDSPVLN